MADKPYPLCFDTLANDLRFKILDKLKEKPRTVNELAEELKAERSRVSHSLQMLRTCSYVNVEKQGRERMYALAESPMLESGSPGKSMLHLLDQHIHSCCHDTCKKIIEVKN